MSDGVQATRPTGTFDWRAYATEVGTTPMHAWIACSQAFRRQTPPSSRVGSPASLDRLCADPAMHDMVRSTIDSAARHGIRKVEA